MNADNALVFNLRSSAFIGGPCYLPKECSRAKRSCDRTLAEVPLSEN